MKENEMKLAEEGFCTFCMRSYEPERIGAHLMRCADRRDDAGCIQVKGDHPLAFLLMVVIEGWPEAWLCLEAHTKSRLSDLRDFLRYVWLPGNEDSGSFSLPKRKLRRRVGDRSDWKRDWRLEEVLRVKDEFFYSVQVDDWDVQMRFKVVGQSETAVMHRSVDLAAFPVRSDGGRSPSGQPRDYVPAPDWDRDFCPV